MSLQNRLSKVLDASYAVLDPPVVVVHGMGNEFGPLALHGVSEKCEPTVSP